MENEENMYAFQEQFTNCFTGLTLQRHKTRTKKIVILIDFNRVGFKSNFNEEKNGIQAHFL